VDLMPAVEAFLRQNTGERSTFPDTKNALHLIANAWPF
jgi:hypothetical protein